MIKRILIAVDEGGPAARAVEVAGEMARQLGASVAVIHVVDSARAVTPELAVLDQREMRKLRRDGALILNRACAAIPPTVPGESMLLEGEPAECIISLAKDWTADLIVIGSDSRGRLAHFLLGSTADSVIRRAPCPVITVRMSAAIPTENDRPLATA